jgi:predicted Zn-dependent protease
MDMRIRSAFVTPFVVVGLAVLCFAQTKVPSSSTAAKPADYSQEGALIEHYANRLTFESDGSSVREINAVVKVQAEAGVQELAVLKFAYTSSSEAVDVDYVRVRKADGTVVNTPAYNIQDLPADLTREAPMYSDIHQKHITVKALGVGDTLEYLIRYRTTKPEIPGQFWYDHNFIKDSICKDELLEINVPKDKYVKVSSTDLQPQIREEDARKIYTWKSSSLERKEENKKEIPRRETPRPAVEVTTFHGWDEVGAWYATLQKDQLTVTPDVQKKAAEITKGLSTDDEKIRALYDYVSTHFHYVSLSFGIGRYQPHAADDVLGNEYGDCKDKHTLLATLLEAVGIDAWPALINSTRKIDDDLPAPSSFDHVITVVPRGNQMIWLDTTPEVGPFGFLFTGLRGKEALVIPTGKPAALMKTPESIPFPFKETFSAEGKLSADGVFTGHMVRTMRGDNEVLTRIAYRRLSPAKWDELTQRISYLTNFAGDVSNVKVTPPEETAKTFEISYDYTRKHYGDWDNHRIGPPLPPFGIEVPNTDERKPVEPFLLGGPGEIDYHAKIELPSASNVTAPGDVDLNESFAEYHAHYSLEKGVLAADRQMIIKKSEVPVADWDKYTKFRKAVSDDEDQMISVRGATVMGLIQADPLQPTIDDSEAGKKFREAMQAMQNRDVAKASDLMREVLKLDPNYQGAHATLGWVYLGQNRREDALAEINKEEELHPDYVGSYTLGAMIYGFNHQNDKVAEQWRKLLKVQPDNQEAATKLSETLINQEKYQEAIVVLEPAVKANGLSQTLQVSLANAYLHTSQPEKAVAIIVSLVNDLTDFTTLNDLAYLLSDANVDLDFAKDLSLRSNKGLAAITFKGELSETAPLVYTWQVAAGWDTTGWIYFRMGKYQEALDYLHPAWLLGQSSEVGDHLGQTYQKLGRSNEAQHTYELALSQAPLGKIRDDLKKHYKQLTGKEPADGYTTHRLPNGSWSMTPGEELSRMRTTKLPDTSPHSGSATFAISFAFGKVEEVAYLEGSDQLKAMGEKLKTAKFEVSSPKDGVPMRLVRRGILSCHSGSCDFTLVPPNSFVGPLGTPGS